MRQEDLPAPENDLQPLARIGSSGATVRHPGIWQVSDGRTDDASGVSAEVGARILPQIADALSRFIVNFHQDSR